ncbi:MAG: hypothetical protein HC827_07445 [Cyanobacteria bacterium RM1_2_2]|nr:hypothetical protein [Cyanobacteria bacterium RM1_2_2]
MLTATILENEDEPIEGAAGNLLRQRRRANRPSENVKVDIPVSDIFSLNYQIWNEVSGGFLIPDSLVNVDYSVVEVGFLAPPTAERPNLTNRLKIATSVEFGAGFAEQLTSATADVTAQPIEVLFRAGVMSGRPSAIDAATTQSLVAEVAAEQVVRPLSYWWDST